MRRDYPGEEGRLSSKRFTRGRHNDVNFVRWPLDDVRFTARVVDTLAQHLRQALAQVERVVVVTHHPPLHGISFPQKRPPLTSRRSAVGGIRRQPRRWRNCSAATPSASPSPSAATRTARAGVYWHGIRGYNVGGDYHFKRLLWLDWPAGTVTDHQFGDAAK